MQVNSGEELELSLFGYVEQASLACFFVLSVFCSLSLIHAGPMVSGLQFRTWGPCHQWP